jgi:Na+/H+-dicarboxylate symporter
LIVGVDRPLDMLRTTNNITGDAMVASVVADSENQLAHEAAAAAPGGDGMAEDVESSVGEPARRPARSSEQ